MKGRPFVFLILGLALACVDKSVTPERTLIAATSQSSIVTEGENAPDGVPEELNFPTSITVTPEASFQAQDQYAMAIARVDYIATNALAKATVTTSAGQADGESETSDAFPGRRYLDASAILAQSSCSGTVTGKAYGKVWNGFGGLKWAEKSDTRSTMTPCPRPPPPPPPPPPTGGGNTGGGDPTSLNCFILDIDYYEYYPATGEVVWTRSSSTRFCLKDDEI
jgi:hypothetical protein